ncbi:PadR family transcriptional regulator [uncultured Cellulomonas sp.]|uniref:PadR family transcriptional regulator n=1 Tax=uncultured Cellulomonas sp. TaxID=189682 RepID=UPI002602C4E9|nr:PadR family transcriptional regulator [uncultured Cellulomonas sp.]
MRPQHDHPHPRTRPGPPADGMRYRMQGPGADGGFGPSRRGPHGHGGPGGRRGRGPRARGDVRSAVLLLLAEQPRHGYELIQEIADRTSGAWTPSPGSVYPTLQALEDEGLVRIEQVEGRRVASLTEQGVQYVEDQRAALGEPWSTPDHDHASALAVRRQLRGLMDAVGQVAKVGTPAQNAAAATVLDTARRDLYRVLADGPADDE